MQGNSAVKSNFHFCEVIKDHEKDQLNIHFWDIHISREQFSGPVKLFFVEKPVQSFK